MGLSYAKIFSRRLLLALAAGPSIGAFAETGDGTPVPRVAPSGHAPALPAPTVGQNVVLARPLDDVVPSFLGDIDTYIMSDELVDTMEKRYDMRLREFMMQQGYVVHLRDSRLQRNYFGSPAQEAALQNEMAHEMQKFMLIHGVPRLLSSRKSTRFVGQAYSQTINYAQNIGRVEIKSKDTSWKFGTGVNPFTRKFWVKYYNPYNNIEAYTFVDHRARLVRDTTALSLTGLRGQYTPHAQYYILTKAMEAGINFRYSGALDYELKTYLPFTGSTVQNAVTSIASSYRF